MSSFINRLYFFTFLSLFGLVLNAQDDINITSPAAGDVYAGDVLSVSLNYASPDSGYSSPRWSYKLGTDSSATPGGATEVSSYSVSSSNWLSGLAYGQSRWLHVFLLDQATGNSELASDSIYFTYQSGSGGSQSGTSGTQSPDSIYILFPTPQFPSNITPKLWLDASNLTNAGATWADRSTFGNDATKFGSPVLEQHNDSGLNTMRYSGDQNSGDYHQFPEITDIRTVFWVVSEDSDATGHRHLLGTNYGTAAFWHDDGNGNMFGQSWADSKVYNGSTRLNGLAVNGRTTPKPHNLSVISHVTTGNVSATNFSKDRNWSDRLWKGKLGELIIFNTELSDADIRNVENYLGEKWKIPGLRTLYEDDGNDLQVQWNYQSQDNGMQSVSWAYKLDEDFYGTSTSATQVGGNDSVDGSTWLSGVSYGSHTLYVALLDQTDSNHVLDTDHHTFTYQSGTGGTQSTTGTYNGPTEWTFTNAGATGSYGPAQSQVNSSYSGTSLEGQVTINTQGIQEWVVPVNGTYRIEVLGAAGGSYFHDTTGGSGGRGVKMVGEFSLTKDEQLKILIGQLGESIGSSSVNATQQYGGAGGGGGTFVVGSSSLLIAGGGGSGAAGGNSSNPGRDGNVSTDGGAGLGRSDASGAIGGTNGNAGSKDITKAQKHDPGAGYFQSSTNNLSYGSASAGAKSFADGGAGQDEVSQDQYGSGGYGGASAGNERKGGAGGGYSGGGSISTRGVANSYGVAGGGGSYNSGTNQNNQAGVNAGHGQVVITLISSNNNTTNHSNFDLIKVSSPGDPYLIGTSGNDLEIEWSYASPSGGSSSPRWSYKLDEDYSTGSAGSTQTNAMVPGSAWLGGVNDGWHTLYVALLDEQGSGQELSYASYTFNYQSSGSAVQSPDWIAIVYPDVTYLHSSDSNGLEVHWNYQSQSDAEQSLSWAYSLNGEAYSSPISGTKYVSGSTWLNGLSYDWHELRVALLDQASGAQLAYASHMFKYESGNAGTQSPTGGTSEEHHHNPPYFFFSSNDLSTLASGSSLPEGNYTILKEHNASDSQPFKLAPVFEDSNGYVLVEINASVDSSATFAELESYLDSTQIVEQGYVDFMPFDFRPLLRIDVNQSSVLLSLSNGYDEIYFQEFNDSQSNTRYWALSIEEDGNETNKSSLVVDMAGFVYEGNFEDYWYHTFGIAVYAPNTEPEQKHPDWNETEYTADSQGIASVLHNHQSDLSFRQMLLVSNLEISENTPAQSAISQFSLSVPRIMGDLNFTVYSDISTASSALAIDQQGNLRSLTSFDFETSNQISFVTRATDPFGRSIEGNFSLTVVNQVEDYDGDGVEDHIDTDDDNDTFSDSIEQQYGFDPRDSSSHPNFPGVSTAEEILLSSGAYRLGGTLLATGGVPVTEYGIRLKQAHESIFQIYGAANLGTTTSYSLDFGALEIGEDYFYQAYATNLAGTSLGALKKFTTSSGQFWWSSATELSGGWKSSWVGEFLPFENGWIYHVDLEWAFVKEDRLGGIWMWVDDEGWLWSSDKAWPFLWASSTKGWLYPMKVGVRTYLYDYSSESVRSR